MNYTKPEGETIKFENKDIITKSGNCGHKTSGRYGDGCPNNNHSNEHSWGKKCKKKSGN